MKKIFLRYYVLISMVVFTTICNTTFGQDSLPYLGQTPPGDIPERFGPSFLQSDNTWNWFGAPVFSPDGKEMYFVKYLYTTNDVKMYYIQDIDGVWTTPQIPSFVGNIRTESPRFGKDNNKLFILRDLTGVPDFKVYTIERTAGAWNSPQLINIPYNNALGSMSNISISNDSTIYFTLHTFQGAFIYRSKLINGHYSQYERLPNQINGFNSSSPYIEPNERYIIFESERPGTYGQYDLYVSFKDSQDNWTNAINLGSSINSSEAEYGANISPDGKYLFFNSKRQGDINYNAYWVDAEIIEELNPFAEIENFTNNENNTFQIFPNPCTTQTTISLELANETIISLVIFNIAGIKVKDFDGFEKFSTGKQELTLDTSNLQSGIYMLYLQLESGKILTRKIVIL